MASAQRGWISAMDQAAAGLLAQRGTAVSAVLAVVLLVIAIGVFMPGRAARAVLVLAVAVAALIWVAGENFGGVFTGSGTDPNSGPLLALLAAAYRPRAAGLAAWRDVGGRVRCSGRVVRVAGDPGAPPGRRPDSAAGALPAAPDGKRRHAVHAGGGPRRPGRRGHGRRHGWPGRRRVRRRGVRVRAV